jgi:hypothetical protein
MAMRMTDAGPGDGRNVYIDGCLFMLSSAATPAPHFGRLELVITLRPALLARFQVHHTVAFRPAVT